MDDVRSETSEPLGADLLFSEVPCPRPVFLLHRDLPRGSHELKYRDAFPFRPSLIT